MAAAAALCLSNATVQAQITGACEDVTGEGVNPSCWREMKWATEHFEEVKSHYPAGTSSVADFQCAIYLKGKINPKTGASVGAANHGCTLPPCSRLSPSMSSGDSSQSYNEVFSDKTPDFCTPEAMKKNAQAAAELKKNGPAPAPAPAADSGDWQKPIPEERDGFEVGDHVKWIGADQDVPAGSIGKVVGFEEDGIDVKENRGVFNFLPSELEMVSEDEAEAYEAAQSKGYWTTWGVVLIAVGAVVAGVSCWFHRSRSKGKSARGVAGSLTSGSESGTDTDGSPVKV